MSKPKNELINPKDKEPSKEIVKKEKSVEPIPPPRPKPDGGDIVKKEDDKSIQPLKRNN